MSTKIHQLVDGQGRPLVIALTHGQAGDSPTLKPLLSHEAYSSRAIRAELRSRRVKAVIPQPSDQIAHRKRRGSAGGRPPAFDPVIYKGRNVIERSFNDHKQWRGLATRYDARHHLPRRGRPTRHHHLASRIGRHALAEATGISANRIGEIVRGKARITPEVALRLGRALGVTDRYWLNMQSDYDLEEARERDSAWIHRPDSCSLIALVR